MKACCSGCSSLPFAEAFDGADLTPFGLHREHQARAHGLAVEQDRAGAADAVLTTDMRPGLAAFVADGVDQRAARIDADAVAAPVDGERDLALLGHAAACSSARRVTVRGKVAAIVRAGGGIVERIDRRGQRRRRRFECCTAGRTPGERLLGRRDPPRLRLDAADRHPRLADHAVSTR